MKKRTLAAIGLLSLLISAIALAPATMLRLLPLQGSGIELGRLSGSLWSGRSAYIVAQQHRLDEVSWTFLASSLLTARLGLQLEARHLGRPLSTVVEAGVDQTLYLQDTRLSLPASFINTMGWIPIGEIAGDISADIAHAEISHQSVPLAVGVLYWREASVTVAETARLGNVQITLDGIDDDKLLATLKSQGGDITLSGDAEVLPAGDYDVDVSMVAGNSASNNVKNTLRMFAKPQGDGSFSLSHQGNIFELGF